MRENAVVKRPLEEWPPVLKLMWAHKHLIDLDVAVKRFETEDPAALMPEFLPKRPGHNFRYVVTKQPPTELGLMIGDVIDNMRSALDHAVYELTVANIGHEVPQTAFPVCVTKAAWATWSRRHKEWAHHTGMYKLRGVPRGARTLIREHQPFHWKRYRRRALWIIEELWNIDKHRSIHLTTTAPSIGHSEIEVLNPAVSIVRERHFQGRPIENAIVGRSTYSKGSVESDVSVKMSLSATAVFKETSAGMHGPVVETLTRLENYVTEFLAALARFDPTVA
jgi:hypothetical protein